MKILKTAVLPKGFKANGVSCGIKRSGKPDLALFCSLVPAIAALKYTTNKLPAAPIILNNQHFKRAQKFHAIIANSGNANAFCGKHGLKVAETMARDAAKILGVKKENIFVASTGIIAKPLPVEKISRALPKLAGGLSRDGIAQAKLAIKTTDKFTKEISVKFNLGSKTITICGVAKGAGMISPKMATLLGFIFTDANITPSGLKRSLNEAVEYSFNRITVDGCMSTNDTVICLANKMAANALIDNGASAAIFTNALKTVCLELAKMMIRDGEGATKLITIKVSQAKSTDEAKKIALCIANSNLFKTAMYAASKNIIGRIVAAVGQAGFKISDEKLKIKYTDLKKKEVSVEVAIGRGKQSSVVYASDLTHEYVKINAQYN